MEQPRNIAEHLGRMEIDARPSRADWLLNISGPLTAVFPEDRDPIRHGHIYVAPPDHHLLVAPHMVRLSRGPKENRTRPAADPLFRSAAETYGPRVIGVVLSGTLNDGTAGLDAIKRHGGTAVVQDPADAAFAGMPLSALQHVKVDYCVPVAEMSLLPASLCALAKARGRA
jgi:two-component system chemotaxis response regulator CheB